MTREKDRITKKKDKDRREREREGGEEGGKNATHFAGNFQPLTARNIKSTKHDT